MFIVYIIRSENTGKIYIGQTSNLDVRLQRHNRQLITKKSSFTHKNGGNWKPVYTEQFATRTEAVKREKELKSHQGREFIKKVILGGVCRTA